MAVQKVWFKILAAVFPMIALSTVWPMVKEMPPIMIPLNFNATQVLLVIPFYLALISGPGYLYALFSRREAITPRWMFGWKKWSLNMAIVASVGGLTSVMAVIPFPFVLGSLLFSIILRRDMGRKKVSRA